MKDYRSHLPKKIVYDGDGPLCQHLDKRSGDSCERIAYLETYISEGEETDRVHLIFLCEEHARLRGINL